MPLNREEQEELYGEIVKVYDFGREIVNALEREGSKRVNLEIELATPIIDQLDESIEIVSECYLNCVKDGMIAKPSDKKNAESAMRKLFHEGEMFINRIKALPVEE